MFDYTNYKTQQTKLNIDNVQINTWKIGDGKKIIFAFPPFLTSGVSYLYPFRNLDYSIYSIISFDLPNWIGYSEHAKALKIVGSQKITKSIIDFYNITDVELLIADSYGTAMCIANLSLFNNLPNLVLVSPIVKDFRPSGISPIILKMFKYQPLKLFFKRILTSGYKRVVNAKLKGKLKQEQLNEYCEMVNNLDATELLNYLYDLSTINLPNTFIESAHKITKTIYILSPNKDDKEFRDQITTLKDTGLNFEFQKIKGDHNDFMTTTLAEEIPTLKRLLTFRS